MVESQPEVTTVPEELTLPSTRLIELETLLRQREQENERLTIQVTTLRKHLVRQPPDNISEQFTLPPALLSLVLPYLADPLESEFTRFSGNSVTIALTQRAKQLQEENDELYELLKHGETGRLKEEVKALRQVVRKMERALTESHGIISSLSTELDKCYEVLSQPGIGTSSDNYPGSNGGARRQASAGTPGGGGGINTKPIPTGPRAQKRPRMSSTRVSQSPRQVSKGLPAGRQTSLSPRRNVNSSNATIASSSSLIGPSRTESHEEDMRRMRRGSPTDWERDRDRERGRDYLSPLPSAPFPHHHHHREWDRDRDRDRDKDRDRDRDVDRDRDRDRNRNRGGGTRRGGRERERRGRGGGESVTSSNWSGGNNRGLVERLGL